MEKCYSINEEDFSFDSVEEAAESVWHDSEEYKAGDVITIWEADKISCKASDFTPCIDEYLIEAAYEKHGEYAESWDFTEDQRRTLQSAVDAAVDAWAESNGVHPKFYGVTNVAPVQVRFIDDEGGCEVIPDNVKDQAPANAGCLHPLVSLENLALIASKCVTEQYQFLLGQYCMEEDYVPFAEELVNDMYNYFQYYLSNLPISEYQKLDELPDTRNILKLRGKTISKDLIELVCYLRPQPELQADDRNYHQDATPK